MSMRWVVELALVEPWLDEVDSDSYQQVIAALELLAEHGPHLGRPLVDSIAGSRHHNMKELRPGSTGGSEIRMLFAFDPLRAAIVLVAGDKSREWSRWYRRAIRDADVLFDQHLASMKGSAQ